MSDGSRPNELDVRPQSRREWTGYLQSLIFPIALVVVIVGGLLYWQSRGDSLVDSAHGTVALPAEKNPTGQEPSASEGRAAPDFLLQTLDGATVRLSDLQGRPVLVNFWAAWCGPCREEMPRLIDASERHAGEGLVVLAVNLREGPARIQGFVDDFGIEFTVAFDRDGEVARTWRIGGPTEGLPSSYFIGADGVIRKVAFGAMTSNTIDEGLALILPGAS
jgi:cytochrome c biogenesis protein CcmG/thiol:disulfide interchange protein DsbE